MKAGRRSLRKFAGSSGFEGHPEGPLESVDCSVSLLFVLEGQRRPDVVASHSEMVVMGQGVDYVSEAGRYMFDPWQCFRVNFTFFMLPVQQGDDVVDFDGQMFEMIGQRPGFRCWWFFAHL